MKLVVLIVLFTGVVSATAQEKRFSENDLISAIISFHPVAKQAAIDVKIARAGILSGRGGFDPQLSGETARKEFGGITYYDHRASEIRLPAWYGIDLFAGTEKISGSRLNPEETQGGITYMGFSIQPIQNLLIDKRRAALRQAKIFYQLSEVQQKIVLNDLLNDALFSYWEWWEKYHVQQVVKAALVNAEKRLALVRGTVQLGDRPAIDTLEACTQVQAFQVRLAEAWQHVAIAQLQLSAYLWTAEGGQAELPPGVVPQNFKEVTSFTLEDIVNFSNSHPALTQYDFKLKGLQIDKRLAFQSLLPEVKIKYNQTGYDFPKTVNGPWFNNNYRYGIHFSVPLRLSEGRGDYQKAKLKIESTRLDQANKRVQLTTKVRQYFTEWQQTTMQLSIQNELLANTRALQKGEEIRFANGESSLFLVNAREQKTIEAALKKIELQAKSQKAATRVKWSAGILAL